MADPTVLICPLYIHQGEDFDAAWPLQDLDTGGVPDFTGWLARCEVRASFGGNIITRFHSNGTWDGTFTVDTSGNLIMSLAAAKTILLSPVSNAVYDIELVSPGGKIKRIVQGRAHVTPEVTTDA